MCCGRNIQSGYEFLVVLADGTRVKRPTLGQARIVHARNPGSSKPQKVPKA